MTAAADQKNGFVELVTRVVHAQDPRSGKGWGPWEAARTPLVTLVTIALWALTMWFGVAVPEWLLNAVTSLALALWGHDAGVMAPQKG